MISKIILMPWQTSCYYSGLVYRVTEVSKINIFAQVRYSQKNKWHYTLFTGTVSFFSSKEKAMLACDEYIAKYYPEYILLGEQFIFMI